jgi:hypothetical protein
MDSMFTYMFALRGEPGTEIGRGIAQHINITIKLHVLLPYAISFLQGFLSRVMVLRSLVSSWMMEGRKEGVVRGALYGYISLL